MTSFANRKMAEMLGTTVQEMLWQPIIKYMDEADRSTAHMYLERRRQGIREKFEFRFRRLNGTFLWTAIAANPVYDSEGKYLGSLRMVSDITDRKQTAELLSRSQEDLRALAARLEFAREEESTRIAREVHDELGQNLTAISMDLARLKKTLATSKDRELKAAALEKIEGISQTLLTTVGTVRHICSELRPNALEDVGLSAAIESYALQFQARSNIRISLSLSSAPATIEPARRLGALQDLSRNPHQRGPARLRDALIDRIERGRGRHCARSSRQWLRIRRSIDAAEQDAWISGHAGESVGIRRDGRSSDRLEARYRRGCANAR